MTLPRHMILLACMAWDMADFRLVTNVTTRIKRNSFTKHMTMEHKEHQCKTCETKLPPFGPSKWSESPLEMYSALVEVKASGWLLGDHVFSLTVYEIYSCIDIEHTRLNIFSPQSSQIVVFTAALRKIPHTGDTESLDR